MDESDTVTQEAPAITVPVDGWSDDELRILVEGYARALMLMSWSQGAGASLVAELEALLPGRDASSIEHRLGFISAILEEEGLSPLPSFRPRPGYPDRLRGSVMTVIVAPGPRAVGKYASLTAWLSSQTVDELDVTFSEIEAVLGFLLPPSSRRHVVHWHSADGSAVVRAIHAAGWRARRVDLRNERLTFSREP